ncbi:hypothetical protein ACH4OY_00170 [Micromonospora rubida]|uniref:Uncharacterized protein n=1 Tax=Micromonospora rubida TaxID=2697657 RepID=A0ABW7SD56_9ACTN
MPTAIDPPRGGGKRDVVAFGGRLGMVADVEGETVPQHLTA